MIDLGLKNENITREENKYREFLIKLKVILLLVV